MYLTYVTLLLKLLWWTKKDSIHKITIVMVDKVSRSKDSIQKITIIMRRIEPVNHDCSDGVILLPFYLKSFHMSNIRLMTV